MTHDEAVKLEGEFFLVINKPEFKEGIEKGDPGGIFREWWSERLGNDTLWLQELATISELVYAFNLISDLYSGKEFPMGGLPVGDVFNWGRENMIRLLERGGYA